MSESLSPADVIDAERAQIGHEIHDALLPLIFAASANVQNVLSVVGADPESQKSESRDSESREKLHQAHQWLCEALQLGRQLLTTIYPPELDRLPWLVAVKDAVGRTVDASDATIDWSVDDDFPLNTMESGKPETRDAASAAFRIVIESVRNAVRHGGARQIDIQCAKNAITIADDGTGFEPDQVDSSRFGIRSMKGRARMSGGGLSVQSRPGGPTVVQFTLPDLGSPENRPKTP